MSARSRSCSSVQPRALFCVCALFRACCSAARAHHHTQHRANASKSTTCLRAHCVGRKTIPSYMSSSKKARVSAKRQAELISQFCAVTSSSEGIAKRYLSAADWECEPAVNNYFSMPPGEACPYACPARYLGGCYFFLFRFVFIVIIIIYIIVVLSMSKSFLLELFYYFGE